MSCALKYRTDRNRREAYIHGRLIPHVYGDWDHNCKPSQFLARLFSSNQLPNFKTVYCEPCRGVGNCHYVALALMRDLSKAGSEEGWEWVLGNITVPSGKVFLHSWNECYGWTIDASQNECSFAPSKDFYASYKVGRVARLNPQQTRNWYRDRSGTRFLGFQYLHDKIIRKAEGPRKRNS